MSSIPWLPDDLSALRVQRIVHRSGFDADRYSYTDLIHIWQAVDAGLDQTPKNAGDVTYPEAYLVVRMKLAATYALWHPVRP
ncbi:TPA: NAD-glutamate dehydrogenase [Enterococcus faecium]|nr:NAD-glutamate dehydrogenase [Enterococcus faecium]